MRQHCHQSQMRAVELHRHYRHVRELMRTWLMALSLHTQCISLNFIYSKQSLFEKIKIFITPLIPLLFNSIKNPSIECSYGAFTREVRVIGSACKHWVTGKRELTSTPFNLLTTDLNCTELLSYFILRRRVHANDDELTTRHRPRQTAGALYECQSMMIGSATRRQTETFLKTDQTHSTVIVLVCLLCSGSGGISATNWLPSVL